MLWDPARFQQVVWNLVDNAMKFSEQGGVVSVDLVAQPRRASPDRARPRARHLGRVPAHIFERFRQEDATTRRRHSGLGLGLAIVKQLVEAHGGTIAVTSPGEGQGAVFTVSLPHAVGRTASSEPRRGTPDLHGVRVLVVEDDADARSFVRRVLSDAGAEVREASDVPSALSLIDPFGPHVLVSDIGMPREDGYDLIRRDPRERLRR